MKNRIAPNTIEPEGLVNNGPAHPDSQFTLGSHLIDLVTNVFSVDERTSARNMRSAVVYIRIIAGIIATLVLSTSIASANGGQVRVDQEQIGPYVVSVTTNPIPLRVGTIDISVLVGDPLNGSYLEDAEIMVIAESLDHQGVSSTHQASHELASEERYQASEFELSESGRWGFTVSVNGPDGAGTTYFEADVAGQKGLNWLSILPFLIIVPAIVGIAGYLLTRNRPVEQEE